MFRCGNYLIIKKIIWLRTNIRQLQTLSLEATEYMELYAGYITF
jgi:hypothetical protein